MKKKKQLLTYLLLTAFILITVSGCNREIPDDFNICFQFGDTDSNLVTIDTYNEVITLGADQQTRLTFQMSDEDKAKIYTRMVHDNIHGYKGEYRGTTAEQGTQLRFAIKFTANKRTRMISGNNTTKYYKKKDTSSLLAFRDYMIEYVKGTEEYKKLING